MQLAREVFTIAGSVYCRVASDPETSEECLVLELNISGSIREILASDNRLRTMLVESIPADKLYYLRLSYNAL